jgi:hypothetical protein
MVQQCQRVLSDRERCSYDDGGISKLIGIWLVLLADTQAWLRTSKSIDNIPGSDNQADKEEDLGSNDSASSDDEDDNESRSDDITASVILSSLADRHLNNLFICSSSFWMWAWEVTIHGEHCFHKCVVQRRWIGTLQLQ